MYEHPTALIFVSKSASGAQTSLKDHWSFMLLKALPKETTQEKDILTMANSLEYQQVVFYSYPVQVLPETRKQEYPI